MATALDLLMSTKEDVDLLSEESNICTIDAKTRVIFVPSTIVVGGVQSDKNAERIKFSCPKIVGDNLDLSKFSVRINFENVSSVDFNISIKDQYICDDVAVDGENVTFSWLIGRNAARYMGTVRFIVCAVKTDSDSNISVEWNTTIAEVPVLEGIEIDQPQIGQEEKDVINQLLELTKNTSAEAVQNVNSAKEQAIKDIQSVSQPDTTLTIEGGLAEAKATGEAIDSLKEDLAKGKIVFLNLFNKTQIIKGKIYNPYVNATDTQFINNKNGFYCTQKFPCKNGDKIYVTTAWAYILIYNNDGTCVQVFNSDEKEYTVNKQNASYFRYCSTNYASGYIDKFMISINEPLPDYYVRYDESVFETRIVNYINEKTYIAPLKTHILINFDDNISNMEDNIPKLMFDKYGYRFTFNGYSDNAKELLKKGCDLATYSNEADELPSYDTINSTSEADILAWDNYVKLAKERQEAHALYNPTMWACRQLMYGTALEKALKKYGYKITRGSGDENGFDLSGQTYQKVGCVVPTDHSLDYVKTCIDNAIKNNKHLIVLFHKVLDTVPSGDTWDIDKTYFIQIMDYIKSKVDNGLCEIITARELYHLSNPDDAYNNDYNRLLKSIN